MDKDRDRSAVAELSQLSQEIEAEVAQRAADFMRAEPPRYPVTWAITRSHPLGGLDGEWSSETVALPEYAEPYIRDVLEILAAGLTPTVTAQK